MTSTVHRWTPLTTLGFSCLYGYGCLVWRELLIWGNQNNSSPHTFSVIFTAFFNPPLFFWYPFLLLWRWHKKLYHECDIMCIRNIWRYVYALELHSFCCLYEVYVFLQQFVGVKQLLCHYNGYWMIPHYQECKWSNKAHKCGGYNLWFLASFISVVFLAIFCNFF